MLRRVVAGVLLLALLYAGYRWYTQRSELSALASGDVKCVGCDTPDVQERYQKEHSGEAAGTTDQSAIAAHPSTGTSAKPGDKVSATGKTIVPSGDQANAMSSIGAVPVQDDAQGDARALGPAPAGDSIAANPQNNLHFRGSGAYQWYRQGNITWRVDTSTGRSCIVYATLDEWRKQIVLSHGCGRST